MSDLGVMLNLGSSGLPARSFGRKVRSIQACPADTTPFKGQDLPMQWQVLPTEHLTMAGRPRHYGRTCPKDATSQLVPRPNWCHVPIGATSQLVPRPNWFHVPRALGGFPAFDFPAKAVPTMLPMTTMTLVLICNKVLPQ